MKYIILPGTEFIHPSDYASQTAQSKYAASGGSTLTGAVFCHVMEYDIVNWTDESASFKYFDLQQKRSLANRNWKSRL